MFRSRIPPAVILIFTGVAIPACSPTANIHHAEPAPPAVVSPEVTKDLGVARSLKKSRPLESLGHALDATRILKEKLASGDHSPDTVNAYNHAVARAIEAIDLSNVDPWSREVEVPGYSLRAKLARAEKRVDPASYRMIPTDSYKIGGTYFQQLSRNDGLGAPIAMVFKNPGLKVKRDLSESSVYGTATATISFNGRNADLNIYESLRVDTVEMDGHTYPLAADYSTPLAMLIVNQHVEKLGLIRLLWPERYADTARLTRLQLYDPERIPLLLVHGLDSTPATWTPMVNSLRADPEIRKKYQIWVFSYPSGYPYPYSAALLRRELDRIHGQYPDHRPIVLVGHSMGGIISRLMLTDSGDSIWRSYFGKPPSQTSMTGLYRKKLEEALVFNHRTDIGRTIFISAPHRGSEIATSYLGRLGSRLVRTPTFLADVRNAVVSIITVDATALTLERAPSSVDTLAPNNRFVLAVNKLPLVKSIPYHSIIGDRGKGDTPNSSDGVVAYWSSHLDGAVSEKIVPSSHSAHQNPEGIAEVRRILRLHANLPAPSP